LSITKSQTGIFILDGIAGFNAILFGAEFFMIAVDRGEIKRCAVFDALLFRWDVIF